eukprot:8464441-Pyramimonas_sp.AAC.1
MTRAHNVQGRRTPYQLEVTRDRIKLRLEGATKFKEKYSKKMQVRSYITGRRARCVTVPLYCQVLVRFTSVLLSPQMRSQVVVRD